MSTSDERANHEILRAAHVLEYPYTRSVGPVLGRFLAGLRECRIVGVRTAAGRVLVPPADSDPITAEAVTSDFIDVGPEGTVVTWCWVERPRVKQPLACPFAWAMIRLDRADTALLHAVEVPARAAMSTGMRVRPRWKAERSGLITDIECFEPVEHGR